MSEKSSNQGKQRHDLDTRLSAFFGPPLREQPLSAASWQRLRSQLKHRRVSFCRPGLRWRARRFAGRPALPNDVLNAYTDVLDAARLHYPPSLVDCRFVLQRNEAYVRVVPFGKHSIRMSLPQRRTLHRAELRVLLATGLAHYRFLRSRRISFIVITALCLIVGLLAGGAAIAGLLHHVYALCLLLLLWLVIASGLHIARRSYAMQADDMIVRWLGRSQVCQGLHLLANHSAAASRRQWGKLSLVERIERICGTHVKERDERLTLVR